MSTEKMILQALRIFKSKNFLLMFAIVCLLNVNFTILRSLRSTLVVADLGGSASYIPYFELFGTFPAAILMTAGLIRLLNQFSLQRVFFITISAFLGFFLLFAFGLYPFIPAWQAAFSSYTWLPGSALIAANLGPACALLFYIMAELWKIGLLTILFWGLVNQCLSLDKAKTFYAPLMLAGSFGAILAGPLMSGCLSESARSWFVFSQITWTHALTLMMLLMVVLGVITAFLYRLLFKDLMSREREPLPKKAEQPRGNLTLRASIDTCQRSPYLLLLAWIVIVDYIAYSLGEVIFLDVLKERFPLPTDYCQWMGTMGFWSGLLTAFCALVITPWVLRRCSWTVAALVTPICLLLTEGAFFLVLRSPLGQQWLGWNHTQWLEVLVGIGSLQYCLCRAAKYTFFDASKELAFIPLSTAEKMEGKFVIDGVCARFGRSSASALSIILIEVFGGVMSSAGLTGILAMALTLSWIFSVGKLGKRIQHQEDERPLDPLNNLNIS